MKLSRGIIFVWLMLYLLFPNDDQLSSFGFGPPGTRLLIGDVFLLLAVSCSFPKFNQGMSACVNVIGWFPITVFLGCFAFSFLRGFAEYGGGAIGDSRWFCSIILLPIGYLVYDPKYLLTIKKLLIAAATVHALLVLVRFATGSAWDTGGDVVRFASGRMSLIICIGCVCLLWKEFISNKRLRIKPLQGSLLALFLLALLVGQTRTVFLMMPVSFVLIMWNLDAVRLKSAMKIGLTLVLVAVIFSVTVKTILPGNIRDSIYASFGVVGEAFNPRTYELIVEDNSNSSGEKIHARNEFSKSGNTYFRILAWSQILTSISEYPGGWFIGLPMGTPFYWFGSGRVIYENLLPHNDYLAILARVGAIGLAGYVFILARFFVLTRRYSISLRSIQDLPEGLAIIITLLVFILLFVGINAELRAYGSHFWVWLLLGAGIKVVHGTVSLSAVKRGFVWRLLARISRPVAVHTREVS